VHSGIDEFGYLVVRLEVELVVDQAGFLLERIDGVLIFTADVPRVETLLRTTFTNKTPVTSII